jgi:hypothetical protein
MRRRLAAGALAVAGLALAALGMAGAARAASTRGPTLDVILIHATSGPRMGDAGPVIDPQVRDLSPATLQQPPFASYNVYRLLQRQPFALATGKPVTLLLPNGRTLQAVLTGVSTVTNPDGGPGENRYQLEAQIVAAADSGSAAFLRSLQVTVSANEPFFVGGQSYQGGTMFIELNVRP